MTYPREKFLIILSSPSGGGKSSVCKKILETEKDIEYSISYTTREPRKNEVNGIDYFFVQAKEFYKMIENKEFLEHAEVHGNLYGTHKDRIKEILNRNNHVILDIDVAGFKKIQDSDLDSVSIFLIPPDHSTLKKRLEDRQTDSTDIISKRLENAVNELECYGYYDYLVINDDLSTTVQNVKNIIRAEEYKAKRYNNPTKIFWEEK